MIDTLLFDLDDTLLGNDMGTLPARLLRAAGADFAQAAGGERLVPQMLSRHPAMIANPIPSARLM